MYIKLLMHHVRNTLPEMKAKIQAVLLEYQSELLSLGDAIDDGGHDHANIALNIITEFCSEFRTVLRWYTCRLCFLRSLFK
jgi:dynamin 1-like protein